jgi:hypothetical protein
VRHGLMLETRGSARLHSPHGKGAATFRAPPPEYG